MKQLVIDAVNTQDLEMCRRIAYIFIQLGDDYIIPVIDESNSVKDELLEVGLFLFLFFWLIVELVN